MSQNKKWSTGHQQKNFKVVEPTPKVVDEQKTPVETAAPEITTQTPKPNTKVSTKKSNSEGINE